MTFSTLNIIYGLEIVQARGMWFLLLNISSSFARFGLYFLLTFFCFFVYLLGGPFGASCLKEPITFFLNED